MVLVTDTGWVRPGEYFEKHQVRCGLVAFLVAAVMTAGGIGLAVYQVVDHIHIEVEP